MRRAPHVGDYGYVRRLCRVRVESRSRRPLVGRALEVSGGCRKTFLANRVDPDVRPCQMQTRRLHTLLARVTFGNPAISP